MLPFTTIDRTTGRIVGSTSYLAIEPAHKRLEIGGTWITPSHQRSAVNTEAKLLQLTHCFEVLGCNRVEFKTDSRNEKSRTALARIGAVEEGAFRAHMVMPDGAAAHLGLLQRDRERVAGGEGAARPEARPERLALLALGREARGVQRRADLDVQVLGFAQQLVARRVVA